VWCVSTGSAWTAIGDGGSGGSGASVGDSFITVSHDADLTAERTLAGTSNHITVTDGGANNSVTLDTGANVTLSGALSNNTIPKANAAAGLVNSSITDDATTVTIPELAVISPTWNNIATLFTGLTENVTDTASQRNSLLADLQVGGSTRFKVEKSGTTTITGNAQPCYNQDFIDILGMNGFLGAPPASYCRWEYDRSLNISRWVTSTGGSCNIGTTNAGKVNGICYLDGSVNSTMAQAIACAGSSGVIWVSPSASLLSVTANGTIPAGVTLHVDQGAQLSIANGITLTINGDIDAGPYQIFAYTGTGKVSLGYGAETIRALWWPGADIIAQIQNAYNAAPVAPSSTTIIVDAYTGGGCYTATTGAGTKHRTKGRHSSRQFFQCWQW
jgi:hypothetical protein